MSDEKQRPPAPTMVPPVRPAPEPGVPMAPQPAPPPTAPKPQKRGSIYTQAEQEAQAAAAKRAAEVLEEEFGITADRINTWKQRYGSVQVAFFEGKPYVFRGLSRMEWKDINRQPVIVPEQQLALEEEVTNKVLLFPSEFDVAEQSSAGVPTSIFAMVSKLSKFEPDLPPLRL